MRGEGLGDVEGRDHVGRVEMLAVEAHAHASSREPDAGKTWWRRGWAKYVKLGEAV